MQSAKDRPAAGPLAGPKSWARPLALAALIGWAACAPGAPQGERHNGPARPYTVVVTAYPIEVAVRGVVRRGAQVLNLAPPGAEPHDLEPGPEQVEALMAADVVFYLGGLQPAIERALAARRRPAVDVLALPGVDPLPAAGKAASAGAAPASERALDPHVWLDPHRFARLAAGVAAHLGPHADAGDFVARLNLLDRELARGLAHCRRRELVTAHAAFGYLAARYGLRQIAIGSLSPEAEPGPRDLVALVEEAKAAGARVVFTEPLLAAAVSETLAREINAAVLVLDPVEGLTAEQQAAGSDYFSLMRANLASLRIGLECSP